MSLNRINKKDNIQIDFPMTVNFDIKDKILVPETQRSKAAHNQDTEKNTLQEG